MGVGVRKRGEWEYARERGGKHTELHALDEVYKFLDLLFQRDIEVIGIGVLVGIRQFRSRISSAKVMGGVAGMGGG
jgi:hypothetical protein